jgi:hypothetical protein
MLLDHKYIATAQMAIMVQLRRLIRFYWLLNILEVKCGKERHKNNLSWGIDMENEIGAVINTAANPTVNSWLTSLTTTGFIILALTIIIFALAKFGVFNKLLDREIERKKLSTNFNKDSLQKINNSIERLLANDEDVKGRLCTMERTVTAYTKKIVAIERSQKNLEIESCKRSAFDKSIFLIDRMANAIRCLIAGANSSTKDYFLGQLCFEDLEIWNGLCKSMKAKKFWRNATDRPANWKSQIKITLEGE